MRHEHIATVERLARIPGFLTIILAFAAGFTENEKVERIAGWAIGGWIVAALLWSLIKFLTDSDHEPRSFTITYTTSQLRNHILTLGGWGIVYAVLGAVIWGLVQVWKISHYASIALYLAIVCFVLWMFTREKS